MTRLNRRIALWLPITACLAAAGGLVWWTLDRARSEMDTLRLGAAREPPPFEDGHARAIVFLGKRVGRVDDRSGPSTRGGLRFEQRTAVAAKRLGRSAVTTRTLVADTDGAGALVEARMLSAAGVVAARVEGRVVRWTLALAGATQTFETQVAAATPIHVEPTLLARVARGGLPAEGTAALLDLEQARVRAVTYSAQREGPGVAVQLTEPYGVVLRLAVDAHGRVLRGDTLIPGVQTRALTAREATTPPSPLDLSRWGEVLLSGTLPADDAAPLRLRLRGLPAGFDTRALQGRREPSDGSYTVDLARPEETTVSNAHEPAALQALRQPAPFIESDAPELRALAATLELASKSPLDAARLVTEHLRANLKVADAIGPPSALGAWRAKAGNCNEWATLATALLRAGGHPARLAFGAARMGSALRYHAWVEVAEGGAFRAFDPTLGRVPVAATHLRLAVGGVEAQAAILAATGRLTVEVLR